MNINHLSSKSFLTKKNLKIFAGVTMHGLYGACSALAKVNPIRPTSKPNSGIAGMTNRGDSGKVEEMGNQIVDLKITIDGLEKERDFYFGKLRDIEVMCQENDDQNPLIQKILDVLYATEEGFAPPEEVEGAPEEDEY